MRSQYVLVPTEAKRLIAKGVVATDAFQRALESGIVVIHPSSSTVFMLEELGIPLAPSTMWICGLTVPKGLCASAQILLEATTMQKYDPQKYSHQWVLKKGEFLEKVALKEILQEMKAGDVYVKSPNAMDSTGHAGILFTAQGAGTIGLVMKARKKQDFTIMLPTGLEKLIPGPIKKIAAESSRQAMGFCTGTPCGLMPIEGEVVTEIEAVKALTGAQAIPVAAGGVGGAEGATILVINGTDDQVRRTAELLAEIKGSKLPPLHLLECSECPRTKCHLSPVYQPQASFGERKFIPQAYRQRMEHLRDIDMESD